LSSLFSHHWKVHVLSVFTESWEMSHFCNPQLTLALDPYKSITWQ
jgi:hypothetical protein